MRVQTRFPKLWSAGWGCASRPAPGERSAARHHGRDVVCHEPRGIRGEHERNLSLAQTPTSARPECSRRASSWENYLRDHSLPRPVTMSMHPAGTVNTLPSPPLAVLPNRSPKSHRSPTPAYPTHRRSHCPAYKTDRLSAVAANPPTRSHCAVSSSTHATCCL